MKIRKRQLLWGLAMMGLGLVVREMWCATSYQWFLIQPQPQSVIANGSRMKLSETLVTVPGCCSSYDLDVTWSDGRRRRFRFVSRPVSGEEDDSAIPVLTPEGVDGEGTLRSVQPP